jgi:hypothetical protein
VRLPKAATSCENIRLDTIPASVLTTKDAPEIRIYGLPWYMGLSFYWFYSLVWGPWLNQTRTGKLFADAIVIGSSSSSFNCSACIPISASLSKKLLQFCGGFIKAEKAGFGTEHCIASIRITEDFPQWFHRIRRINLPCLHLESGGTFRGPSQTSLLRKGPLRS